MDTIDKENVETLRSLVSDVCLDYTDFDLIRWLKVYNNNLDEVVPKLREHAKLFKSCDLHNYQPNAVLKKYYQFGLLPTVDNNNNLIFIEAVGKADRDGIMKSVSHTQFVRTRVYDGEMIIMDALRKVEKDTGKQAKLIFIQDYEGTVVDAGLLAFATTHYKDVINFTNSHFPEVTAKIILINVNEYIHQIWRAFKALLPESLTNRVAILGSNWKTDILQYVNPAALPVHWGGTAVDENNDPTYKSKIVIPSKVPEELYWSPGPEDYNEDELTSLYVYPGSVEYITIHVDKVGTIVEWYFTAGSGFGFGVYFTDDEDETDEKNMEMIFPDFYFFSGGTQVPERDKIVCHKLGYYKLRFNNYPSWLTTLEIRYKINCTEK